MAPLDQLQEDLSPADVKRLLEDEEIVLIDVREPYEHEAGRIEGARHVEMPNLTALAEGLDRDQAIVFYCRSGSRSAMATQAFRASGYRAYNMAGGLLAWAAQNLPLAPADGTVADH